MAKKTLTGTVVSDKMQKTVVVEVSRKVAHPMYHKIITKTKRIKAQNTLAGLKVGDTVRIVEIPPVSREVHFKVGERLKEKI